MENKEKEEENFLPHLYEPLRIKIAVQYVRQEMRKLFPELREGVLWGAMDKQIGDWHQKLGVRNFWNAGKRFMVWRKIRSDKRNEMFSIGGRCQR